MEWRVACDGAETSAVFEAATSGDTGVVFVCAHGAGGHMRDRNMESLAQRCASAASASFASTSFTASETQHVRIRCRFWKRA